MALDDDITAAQERRCMPLMLLLLLLLMLMVTTKTPPMALPALMIRKSAVGKSQVELKKIDVEKMSGRRTELPSPSSGDELLPRPHAACNQHLPSCPLTRTRTHAQSSYLNHKPRRFVVVVVVATRRHAVWPSLPAAFRKARRRQTSAYDRGEDLVPSRASAAFMSHLQ